MGVKNKVFLMKTFSALSYIVAHTHRLFVFCFLLLLSVRHVTIMPPLLDTLNVLRTQCQFLQERKDVAETTGLLVLA